MAFVQSILCALTNYRFHIKQIKVFEDVSKVESITLMFAMTIAMTVIYTGSQIQAKVSRK